MTHITSATIDPISHTKDHEGFIFCGCGWRGRASELVEIGHDRKLACPECVRRQQDPAA